MAMRRGYRGARIHSTGPAIPGDMRMNGFWTPYESSANGVVVTGRCSRRGTVTYMHSAGEWSSGARMGPSAFTFSYGKIALLLRRLARTTEGGQCVDGKSCNADPAAEDSVSVAGFVY